MAETPANLEKPDGPKQIEKESAYYRQLIGEGKTPAQALSLTRSAAGRFAGTYLRPLGDGWKALQLRDAAARIGGSADGGPSR